MIFNFGKYKGEELSFVIEHDIDYALWVLRNVKKLGENENENELDLFKTLIREKLLSMVDLFVNAVAEAILDVLIIENIWGNAY